MTSSANQDITVFLCNDDQYVQLLKPLFNTHNMYSMYNVYDNVVYKFEQNMV
jgi:hypothetical protein